MSNGYDDWDYDDNKKVIEDYLEDRMEEYLERLERDQYDSLYNNYLSKDPGVVINTGNEEYNALLVTYVDSLKRVITNTKSKPTAYTVISGSGPAWFFEPSSREMVKTERGSEVVVIPGEADEQGRLLVRTMNTFLLVPADDIMSVGFN
tara:strand:+ start:1547 stop:1993 length:447 start_codon:yes stop_codon:yes gene_type:complete